MINFGELYYEMKQEEKYLKEQGFNDEQVMVIGKLTANKKYLERQLTKKDKQIDLMIEDMINQKCYFSNKTLLKQYYEKEASKDV